MTKKKQSSSYIRAIISRMILSFNVNCLHSYIEISQMNITNNITWKNTNHTRNFAYINICNQMLRTDGVLRAELLFV